QTNQEAPSTGFARANDEEISRRRIAGLPRRAQSASRIASPTPTSTSQFIGFSSSLNPFAPLPTNGSLTAPATSVAPTATSAAKTFASFLEAPSSTISAASALSQSTSSSFSGAVSEQDDLSLVKYYTSLRGLNVSLLAALTKASEEDPFVDISDILDRYKSLRLGVQNEFDKSFRKSIPAVPAPEKPAFAPPAPPAPPSGGFSGFGGIKKPSSSSSSSSSTDSTNNQVFGPSITDSPNPISIPEKSPSSISSKPVEEKNTSSSGAFPTSSDKISSTTFSFGSSTSSDKVPSSAFSFGTAPTSTSSFFSFGKSASMSLGSTTTTNLFGNANTITGSESSAPKIPSFGSFGNSSGSTGSIDKKEDSDEGTQSQTDGVVTEDGLGLITKNPHDEEGKGEEDEDTVHDARLRVFKLHETDSGSSWTDLGIGILRIKKHREAGTRRILLRNSGTGKIVLNFKLYSGLKPIQNKKSLSFVGHDETGASQTYTVRLADEKAATTLREVLQKEIASIEAKSDD
ncbi:Nucleoporin nup61, partial [Termitomyces sp. J132]